MTAFQQRPIIDAVVARLVSETGKNIGEAVAPSSTTLPYAVVYARGEDSDPEVHGTLDDAHDSTFFEWQVTSVGETQDQALWMTDKARTALVGWTPVVSGRTFGEVEVSLAQPVTRDDDVSPPRFYGVDEYRVFGS